MSEVKDFVFHGVKARKIGRYIFERPPNKGIGSGFSLKLIDEKVWFASGSFRRGDGLKFAERSAAKMRKAGFKARIVTFSDEIQVFCNKRAGASL